MKILILTHSYPDSNNKWRGLFIQDQAKSLSLNHEVIVVYFKIDYSKFGPFTKYSFVKRKNEALTEYELTTAKSIPVINQVKYLSDTYRFIKKEILDHEKIDLIHSHLSYPAGLLGTIIQKRKKIPNVLTEHSWINNYFRSFIHRISVLYTLKNSRCVITVSNVLKDNVSKFCRREIFVIPNVIDTESFSISGKNNSNKLNLGLLGGMGTYVKGVDILLNASSLLKDMNLLVHIGGSGKHLDEFKEMASRLGIADKCIFYGEIIHEKRNDFYSNLDVYVMVSRRETFGVVVVEAMACGLPVIATRCGGPEEIITPETGILIEKENPDALAEAVRFISGRFNSYNKEAIRNYAIDRYGQVTFNKSMTSLYNNASGQKTNIS